MRYSPSTKAKTKTPKTTNKKPVVVTKRRATKAKTKVENLKRKTASKNSKKPKTKVKKVSAKTSTKKTKEALKTMKIVKPKAKTKANSKAKTKANSKAKPKIQTKRKTTKKVVLPKKKKQVKKKIVSTKKRKPTNTRKTSRKRKVTKTTKKLKTVAKKKTQTRKVKTVSTTTKPRKKTVAKARVNETITNKELSSNNDKKIEKKRFLSDVKEVKSKRIKKQKPIEEIDTSSYLFEKVTAKKRGRRKFIKPIGSAVFRGKRLTYAFDTFDLKSKFEDFPVVFVISKRKVDRFGKGHHKIICVGQTETFGKEINKHKRMAAVKKNKGNVVSILKDLREKERLVIEENLKTRYRTLCLHNK